MLLLLGSDRHQLAGSRIVGPADRGERITLTVTLRRRNEDALKRRLLARHHISREEFAIAHGADTADLTAVGIYALKYSIDVVGTWPEQRRLALSGTIGDLSQAFGTQVLRFERAGRQYRGRVGPLLIPEHLQGIIETVTGFDDQPVVRPRFRAAAEGNRDGTFTATQIGRLYNFPAGFDGAGQTIGLLEFGGGYRDADLDAYFTRLGVPQPPVISVGIDGAVNSPTGDPTSDDGEVGLDIEVIGAIATGARQIVYFAPNTDQGFVDAVFSAVHDASNTPSIISISWGAPEDEWVPSTRQAVDQAFQDAAVLGISIFVVSGDSGSRDGVNDSLLHTDYPAASPWVTACGGTTLISDPEGIADEHTWNHSGGATGGGVSRLYSIPDYQATSSIPPAGDDGHHGRGVPDVSGNADPTSGYQVLIGGQELVFGGTSAVAPLWAGLTALINQMKGSSIGFLNPQVYGIPSAAAVFRDIVAGNNDSTGGGGPYHAQVGWDACTGLGSPDGAKLAENLAAATPPPQPVGQKVTVLAFRTSAGGVRIEPGTSRDLGRVDVHGFERIRVIAARQESSGAGANLLLTVIENIEEVGLLDVLPLVPNSQITRVYEVPGSSLKLSVEAVGAEAAAVVNVWVYGWAA